MINGVLDSNEKHIDAGVANVEKYQPGTVGLLGCAFKEHVDDLRESPALMVASKLMHKNRKLIGHDMAYSTGDELSLPRTNRKLPIMDLEALLDHSDVLVLMHGLPEYKQACIQSGKPYVDLTTLPEQVN
jgi:UDP-glucose 6-dehydrogenase